MFRVTKLMKKDGQDIEGGGCMKGSDRILMRGTGEGLYGGTYEQGE